MGRSFDITLVIRNVNFCALSQFVTFFFFLDNSFSSLDLLELAYELLLSGGNHFTYSVMRYCVQQYSKEHNKIYRLI